MKAASVHFENVAKTYGDVIAVRDVSFEIGAGELVTLLGPSGCGKTTTLRLIAGLEMATSGRIAIGNDDVTSLPATSRDVTMVFQSYALFPHMTVSQNVAYGLSVSGVPKREARAQAEHGLELVNLGGFGARLPSELSGGQQQRVAVARALVLEPSVLLFDEPLSNLDAKLRRQVRQEIRDLQRKLGLTTVYVTHDQEEALAVSDRIIVMNHAQIAQEGTPHALYERPVDSFVADFVGDSNLVDATIESTNGNMARVNIGGILRQLPHRQLEPGPATVAIRPEAVRLRPATGATETGATDGAAGTQLAAGTVSKATYLGSCVEYMVTSPLGELYVVDHAMQNQLEAGAHVLVELAERGVTLVRS